MIDVQDCDTRLPSSGDLNDLYMDELVRLSILLGRVQKTIYRFVIIFIICQQALSGLLSPSGLTFTTDKILTELLADMQRWKDGLPDHLKFKGPETPQNAGTLSCKFDHYYTPDLLRPFTSIIFLCIYDVLACFHEDQLFMSAAPQIWPDC